VRLLNGGSPSYAWLTRGNAGTNPATHFIGTTDNMHLVFRTNNTEKMRITAGGNVGIGTTAPSEKLEILGGGIQLNDTMGIGFNADIPYKANVTGDRARIYYDWSFFGSTGDALVIEKTDGNQVDPDGGIVFTNKGSDNIRDIAMTIRGNGNVGIGTVNPAGKFHVNNDVVGSDSSFVVKQSGNVGIGTTAPGQKLEVVGNIGLSNGTSNAILFNSVGIAPPSVGSTGSKIVLHPGSGLPTNNPRYALGIQSGAIWYSSGGNHIWYTESSGTWTERMRLTSGGSVGIGTTAPSEILEVCGNAKVVGQIIANSSNLSAGVTCSSDIRYKKDITPLTNALNNVMQLRGVYYFWKTKEFPEKQFPDTRQIGFIAQELEKVYPEVVFTDKDGYKSVDYSRLTPILVEAIKEQQKIIQKQQEEINALNEKLNIVINTLSAEKKVGNK
jgi:hypothetical protein